MCEKETLKTVAMTGATSSIGVSLINECIRRKIRVLAFVNPDSERKAVIPDNPLVVKLSCGLSELENFDPGQFSADAFFHLAWGHTKSEERNDPESQNLNIGYSLSAAKLAKKLECHVFLGAGSQAQYGKKQEKISEMTPMEPDTPYGSAKLAAEEQTRQYCRKAGVRHVWPRIFSSYGPYTGMQTVLMYEIGELINGRVPAMSDGEQLWDFLYLEDTARALLSLAENGKDGESYNVASGESRKLKEFMLLTRDAVDPELSVGIGMIPKASNTAFYLDADISKIRKDTGWKPEVPFEEGIGKTVAWVRNREN